MPDLFFWALVCVTYTVIGFAIGWSAGFKTGVKAGMENERRFNSERLGRLTHERK